MLNALESRHVQETYVLSAFTVHAHSCKTSSEQVTLAHAKSLNAVSAAMQVCE